MTLFQGGFVQGLELNVFDQILVIVGVASTMTIDKPT